ncbi:MAG: hypothetical protein ACRYG6_09920, partial [Janthinobacterium lividum]
MSHALATPGVALATPGALPATPRRGRRADAAARLARAADLLAAPRGTPALLLLSAAISVACCLLLFDRDFLDGTAPF